MAGTGPDDRTVALFDAVEQFTQAHNAWVEDANSDHPTIAYWEALDEMLLTFDAGSIPANCRQLAAAVYELAKEKQLHEATDNVDPHHGYWAKREQLENLWLTLKHGARPKYRESVKDLEKQGVPHEQIARIWGLRHRDGSGNSALVARELEFPGSVIGPDYVHPDDREADAAALAIIDRYRGEQASRPTPIVPGSPEDKPCPESSEELWLQKVPIPQAARMLRRSQDDVASEWKEFEQGRIERKQAQEQTAQATPKRAPPPPATVEESTADEDDEDLDDPHLAFADWTDEEVKTHARTLGIIHAAGRWSRTKTLERILAAETAAEAEAKEGEIQPIELQPAEVAAP